MNGSDELIEKFRFYTQQGDVPFLHESIARHFALVCAEEVLSELKEIDKCEHIPDYVFRKWEDIIKEIKT